MKRKTTKTTTKKTLKRYDVNTSMYPRLFLELKKSNPRPMLNKFYPPTFNAQLFNY